jgi:hypothetical protein
MYPKELYWLAMLSSQVPSGGHIVEIGAWCGRSTYPLLHNRTTDTLITVVDTFSYVTPYTKEYLNVGNIEGEPSMIDSLISMADTHKSWLPGFLKTIEHHDDFEVLVANSREFKKINPVNMVLVDGDHTNGIPTQDIDMFIDDPETLIVIDDCVPWWPDVVNATIAAKRNHRRTVIMPTGTKMALILPTKGPMLAAVGAVVAASIECQIPFDPVTAFDLHTQITKGY